MRTMIGSGIVLSAAMLAVVGPGAAQGSVEFTSFAGVYVPASPVIDISGFCPGGPCGQVASHHIAPVFGARVTAWGHSRLAFDFSLGYSSSAVTRHGLLAEVPSGTMVGPDPTDTTGPAAIVTASARVLIGLTPRTHRRSFYVAAGLARVTHRGAAYSSVAGNTGWGAVAAVGGRFWFAPALALRAEVSDHVYRFSGTAFTRPPAYSLGVVAGNYRSPLQHDLALSLGASVAPFGRGGMAP